ncbi:hypothetical protein [uncultured Anaerococcus sp.]|uniref:hypothetical protein n=1 Tax=uncultured Anaerococcus sp. TaxID=293428 RepID=UPI00280AC95C|nr:hypothetical protein [uncultured Anaerococcus sp.]MDU5149079.1 hypothetical protein [Anaerococcus prevotii]
MKGKVFDYREWDIEPMLDTGLSNDFIYGNYVEWDRFREENRKQLLDAAGAYLPLGEEISIDEFVRFISQDIFQINIDLREKVIGEIKLANGQVEYNIEDLRFIFTSEDNSLIADIINEFFDDYGVPSGTSYEEALLEELKYWSCQNDDLYEIFNKYPVKLVDYENDIRRIYEMVANQENELIKKSLILSSLIITENMYKSVIVEKIPEEIFISDFSREIFEKEIDRKLRGNLDYKEKLFKKLYNVKSPKQPWNDLRNSLAHTIDEVHIKGDIIKYINLKSDRICDYSIGDLMDDLLNFSDEIEEIVDSCD